jgi:glycosyltransferase involved in cell wall biosynthesis
MSKLPLVSCVVPTYERPSRLGRAINCILNQTYQHIEVIIVDDSSGKDYASDLVGEMSDKDVEVQLIRHERNRGASAARNSGIESANGKYIAFLDDDDEWLPEKIERQVEGLQQSNADLSYCWVQRVGPEGNHRATHTPNIEEQATKELFKGNFTGTTSTILTSKNLCQNIGGFDTSLPRWNDWDFVLRASRQAKFSLEPEILVRQFNWDGEQLSDDFDKLKETTKIFIPKYYNLASKYNMENKFKYEILFELGRSAGMSDKYDLARRYLLKSIRCHPYSPKSYVYLFAFIGGKYTLRPAQIGRRILIRKLQ